MKSNLIILGVIAMVFTAGQAFAHCGHCGVGDDHEAEAEEMHDHDMANGAAERKIMGDDMVDETAEGMAEKMTEEIEGPVEVGNTICPVSGDPVGEMGEPFKFEYKGKIYNLCCKMCIKDFKYDPEKYSKIAEEEVAASAEAAE